MFLRHHYNKSFILRINQNVNTVTMLFSGSVVRVLKTLMTAIILLCHSLGKCELSDRIIIDKSSYWKIFSLSKAQSYDRVSDLLNFSRSPTGQTVFHFHPHAGGYP